MGTEHSLSPGECPGRPLTRTRQLSQRRASTRASCGLSGLRGVNAERALKEQRGVSALKTAKADDKTIAASQSVALRAQDSLRAVSISYKCLSYKKEVWFKHMQRNE